MTHKTNKEIMEEYETQLNFLWAVWEKTKGKDKYKLWHEFSRERDQILLTEARESERAKLLKEIEQMPRYEYRIPSCSDPACGCEPEYKMVQDLTGKYIEFEELKNKIGDEGKVGVYQQSPSPTSTKPKLASGLVMANKPKKESVE